MRFFSKKKFFSLAAIMLSGLLFSGCGFKSTPTEVYRVKLEVWGILDSDAYTGLFAEYRKINPYVGEINYRKLPIETYKEDLLNALAAGNGPDIFMLRNAWRGAFEDKIVPMPNSAGTEKLYRDSFVDVVASDFIKDGKIYAAPLSVDSLALYYNKDLFNAAGIANPPATWEELLGDVRKLNRINQFGVIDQSAIALGTSKNINRSTDVLTVLMFQMGSDMNQTQGSARIADENSRKALEFYTQFANISSGFYSWNPRLHYSIDAFYENTLGMMINYSWKYAEIKQKNAKLNFGTAPLPQFSGTTPVNFPNYWGFAVAENKMTEVDPSAPAGVPAPDLKKQNYLRVHEAWQLINYMTLPHPDKTITLQNGITGMTKSFSLSFDPAKKYLETTNQPAARRDLIEWQKNNVILAPFATGNLIAKNWYQGNPEAVETIFSEMIDSVNNKQQGAYEALNAAANRVNLVGY